jgi:hypothetical protein
MSEKCGVNRPCRILDLLGYEYQEPQLLRILLHSGQRMFSGRGVYVLEPLQLELGLLRGPLPFRRGGGGNAGVSVAQSCAIRSAAVIPCAIRRLTRGRLHDTARVDDDGLTGLFVPNVEFIVMPSRVAPLVMRLGQLTIPELMYSALS